MNNKQTYSAPEAEILVVKFEENILSELNTNGSGFNEGNATVTESDPGIWSWYENN